MGSEWPEVQLQDIVTKLGDGLHGTPKYTEGGDYFFINGNNLDNGRIAIKPDTKRVSLDEYEKHKKVLNSRTLLVSINGTIGNIAYYKNELIILGKSACYFNLHENVSRQFVRYILSGHLFRQYLESYSTGSTIKNVSLKMMREFSFPLPPLPEQKAIAHILGTLDDKIELNRRMNATLEGMAQALFKSWFVDFDPVIDNALAASNPIPDELSPRAEVRRQALSDHKTGTTQPGSLDDSTLLNRKSLFPAAFQFTEELGWIPEGWKVHPLDQVADFKNGLALQKFRPKPDEDPLPIVKIAQLKTGEATWDELASPSISADCIIDDGDVVFSWSGSLMIDVWCGGKAALNQHLFKVTSDNFPKWFYFKWSDEHLNNFQKIAADKAVTMGHIKRSHLSEALCSVPCNDLIKLGAEHFDPILERIIRNRLHSRSLTKLRDTLLPKLISGELRIREAEQFTKKAVT